MHRSLAAERLWDMPSLVSDGFFRCSIPVLTPVCSRVDLHPTSSRSEEPEEDEADTDVVPASAPTETARRNRRSRILSTLNAGRMRHATADERIEVLRRLREENQTTVENADQGGRVGGERTMHRARARLTRAFGSRPASGVYSSRPTSQVPAAAASAEHPVTMETPSSAEARPHEVAVATEAPTAIETAPAAGVLASSPR